MASFAHRSAEGVLPIFVIHGIDVGTTPLS